MKPQISYKCVDCILNLFYGYYPCGANYFTITYKLNFEAEAWEAMFDFLLDEDLIEAWGSDEQQVITEKGILIIKEHCGVQKYIERAEKRKKSRLDKTSRKSTTAKPVIRYLPSKVLKPKKKVAFKEPKEKKKNIECSAIEVHPPEHPQL